MHQALLSSLPELSAADTKHGNLSRTSFINFNKRAITLQSQELQRVLELEKSAHLTQKTKK